MRRYFRPTGFVDTPVGYDGQVARLAGGMCFFALWEVIEVADGRRVSSRLVPVGALEARDALGGRLSNPGFTERAKPEAVAKAREDHAARAGEAERYRAALSRLG